MTTAVGSSWDVFKAHLQSEGMFFFLPAATRLALEAGELDTVEFDGQAWPEWKEHYLHAKLVRIEAGESPLFQPVLTDPEAWQEIRLHLEEAFSAEPHRNRETIAHLALDDGSVIEILRNKVRVGRRQNDSHPRVEYREEDKGYLVAIRHRHLSGAVNQARRELERLLREGDRAHIVRIAEFAHVPIPGR